MQSEYGCRIKLQRRHYVAIVKSLKFLQALEGGDIRGTIGLAARDAWKHLPDVAEGCYPARKGNAKIVFRMIDKYCSEARELAWGEKSRATVSEESNTRDLLSDLQIQVASQSKCKWLTLNIPKGKLSDILHAVELELRTRISHLSMAEDILCAAVCKRLPKEDDDYSLYSSVRKKLNELKLLAWQIESGANYNPRFTHRTRFLYDIYQVIQQYFGYWRYSSVYPMLPDVPQIVIEK